MLSARTLIRFPRTGSLLVACVAVLSSACATSRPVALCDGPLPEAGEGDLEAAEIAAATAWAEREQQASLETAVQRWREATTIKPAKAENQIKLARALVLLGDAYLLSEADEERRAAVYREAALAADRALKTTNGAYQTSVCARRPFADALNTVGPRDVPAAYWYAVALARYGEATSFVTRMDNRDRVYRLMKRIRMIAPKYEHAGADRFLGTLYTRMPLLGGDADRSRTHFDAALQLEPKYLPTHLAMAAELAPLLPAAEGRALAGKHLDLVMKAPLGAIAGAEPEQRLAKREALRLLEDFDRRYPAD